MARDENRKDPGDNWGPPPIKRSSRRPASGIERNSEPTEPRAPAAPPSNAAPAPAPPTDPLADAVVGWLVIVDGPGRGSDFRLQAGMNSIGRGKLPLIDLSFGDEGITTGVHCRVTFDPRSRRFFLSPGDGQDLTYLSSVMEPVLTATSLESMQDFEIGSTKIRFVPFCTTTFSWFDK